MFLCRQSVRVVALALPFTVAGFSQALVHYGAAVTAGSAAGAAAGKQASDALTKVMNAASSTGQAAATQDEVAAAEAKNAADAAKSTAAKTANQPSTAEISLPQHQNPDQPAPPTDHN